MSLSASLKYNILFKSLINVNKLVFTWMFSSFFAISIKKSVPRLVLFVSFFIIINNILKYN